MRIKKGTSVYFHDTDYNDQCSGYYTLSRDIVVKDNPANVLIEDKGGIKRLESIQQVELDPREGLERMVTVCGEVTMFVSRVPAAYILYMQGGGYTVRQTANAMSSFEQYQKTGKVKIGGITVMSRKTYDEELR